MTTARSLQTLTERHARAVDRFPVPGLLIGKEQRAEGSGGTFDHVNPATGRVQATIPAAGPSEVDEAVAAATAASAEWRGWPPSARRKVLFRLSELITRDSEELSVLGALEAGIPVALGTALCTEWLEHAAGWAERLEGQVVPTEPGRILDYTLPEPYGVVAVILTWNAPLASIGMTVGPPLAAGCCVVLKPSELAPFTAAQFGGLCLEAGIPPGVVSVLPGAGETGGAIVAHPGIEKVSFTGGAATARRIAAACAEGLKPCLFELGGKSANIVFEDANLDAAMGTAARVIGLSGQGCTHPTRMLVQSKVYEEMIKRVSVLYDSIPVDDPLLPTTMMGPVISAASADRILGMIDRAVAAGATVRAGGNRLDGEFGDGFFIRPTVLADVPHDSEISQVEVFGPVLAVTPFEDEDHAVSMANGTSYGLAAYVHTRDISRAHRMAHRLDAGSVGINGGGVPAGPGAPFGGRKQSGFGVEGGLAGVREFLRYKNVEVLLG
jgi:aldehyde dehydrogenase (NAD+)